MARIFFALSVVAVLLLVINIAIGLSIGDYNGLTQRLLTLTDQVRQAEHGGGVVAAAARDGAGQGSARDAGDEPKSLEELQQELAEARAAFAPANRLKTFHFMLGIFAGLVTLLVNAIGVTYFIGTSRWCREVVEAYGLDEAPALQSTRLKRRTFPWALLGMLTMVGIAALGAASDPTGSVSSSDVWVMPHQIIAIVGTALIGWALLVQVGNVGANHELIEQILTEVRRIRRERGLDEEDEIPADPASVGE